VTKPGFGWVFLAATVCVAGGISAAFAQAPAAPPAKFIQVAPTPPMGWNSWDSYGLTIDESQFRANAAAEAKKLLPFGYRYAVVDEGWYMQNPLDRSTPNKLRYQIDRYGRFEPVPSRFPSSSAKGAAAQEETSFRAIADYVHSLGLKFGIHIIRGIPRQSVAKNLPIAGSRFHAADAADTNDACPWDPTSWGVRDDAAGQAWYDSLLRQYADWGVDFLKVDCIATHPYKVDEIRMIRKAIDKTGRPMVLSLSPGPTRLSHAAEVGQLAEMWRISDDMWDFWDSHKPYPHGVGQQFAAAAAWAPHARPGNWPDADMLPLGWLGPRPGYGTARKTRLTHAEQRTQMTLWSMMRSPLVLGTNLTRLDPWTMGLIANREVLAIDQHSRNGRQLEHTGDLIVWRGEGGAKQSYLALFNTGEKPMQVHRELTSFGYSPGRYRMRDLWQQRNIGQGTIVSGTVAPHGCLLLELRPSGRH